MPLAHSQNDTALLSPPCHLDLSDELFGGVASACSSAMDRTRCCPVLAAWLYAAHARTALALSSSPLSSDDEPMLPYDNQNCVDALNAALHNRSVFLLSPNATCDVVLCFCGIRLHQIGSLSCPAAFNVSDAVTASANVSVAAPAAARNATPTSVVRDLERSCKNASYAGCTKCVRSLQKLKGNASELAGSGDRERRILGRDCQLMGLTWLLAKNKTAYIPTVSAVLRAMLYAAHPTGGNGSTMPRCSPDQENMPLAIDVLQFDRAASAGSSSGGSSSLTPFGSAINRLLLVVACVLQILVQMGMR